MLILSIKQMIRRYQMKQKFRTTVFHTGASADLTSKLEINTVLFRNVKVVDTDISKYTYIQENSKIYNTTVGSFCSIASNVTIGLASHPIDMVSSNPVFYDHTQPLPAFFINKNLCKENLPRTYIGADVWIGQGVLVMAGITIGTGSVVGAGSVVTKDILPYSIVGGVPARLIKMRFGVSLCEKLHGSQWWKLDDSKLEKLAPYFNNPEEMLKMLGE